MPTLHEALRDDEPFRRRFLSALSDEAAAECARESGWAVSLDDVRALREASALGNRELSDAELETISGGTAGFTMVSNIMKTKHDTVKNSISDVR